MNREEGRLSLQSKLLKTGASPLHIATENNKVDIVSLFLSFPETDVNQADSGGWTPLHSAAYEGFFNIVEILLHTAKGYLCLNSLNDYGNTPLNIAVMNNQIDIVNVLLENDAKADIPNNEGWTPLHSAASRGFLNIVEILLENDAKTDIPSNNGWTGHHYILLHLKDF